MITARQAVQAAQEYVRGLYVRAEARQERRPVIAAFRESRDTIRTHLLAR